MPITAKDRKRLVKAVTNISTSGLDNLSDSEKREVLNSTLEILEILRKRARASEIIEGAIKGLDTSVNLNLPDVPSIDLLRDRHAISKLSENEAASIKNLGTIVSKVIPMMVTAAFAV